MPGLHRIQVLDRIKWCTIPVLNRKELEMQRSELLWSLSDTLTLDCHVIAAYHNC